MTKTVYLPKSNQGPVLPRRIQLLRTKGWRMPPGTVKVDRSTKWGNPYRAEDWGSARRAVNLFRDGVRGTVELKHLLAEPEEAAKLIQHFVWIHNNLEQLRGKKLACWCRPGQPCHADVLIELANRKPRDA